MCVVCPATGIVNVAAPATCNSFYICVNGIASELQTCNPGFAFDSKLGNCFFEEEVECPAGTEPVGACDPAILEVVWIPDPTNCRFFFTCHEGVSVLRSQCPTRMAFDPASLQCIDELDVVCPPAVVFQDTVLIKQSSPQVPLKVPRNRALKMNLFGRLFQSDNFNGIF